MLLAMHTAYLSGCAWKGIPLACWGIGLTVLLEKIVDSNFVHKLRAICLLEADFIWINKVVFAKWMIRSALERNLIPGKCFSKKDSNCINAVMTKIFIYNESRIHHHDACIAGNIFGDCYDWAAHPIAAISLWSFGVPQPAINVLLKKWSPRDSIYVQGLANQRHYMAVLMKNGLQETVKVMRLQVQASHPWVHQ